MNINHKKSYFLSILTAALFSFIYCMTGGVMRFLAGMVLSSVIGVSVTKHHYIFVGLKSALCVAVLTTFHAISGGVLGAMAGLTAGVILVLMGIGLIMLEEHLEGLLQDLVLRLLVENIFTAGFKLINGQVYKPHFMIKKRVLII